MDENADKQQKKQQKYTRAPWLRNYEWKPGQSGNEKGRPKGKTLKEWAKEFLMSLPDDKKLEFLQEIEPDIVWKMAEGNPATELTGKDGQPLIIQIEKELADKNNVKPSPEDNSAGQTQV